jgi:hypothetical protein
MKKLTGATLLEHPVPWYKEAFGTIDSMTERCSCTGGAVQP